jgi:hypothetical protein
MLLGLRSLWESTTPPEPPLGGGITDGGSRRKRVYRSGRFNEHYSSSAESEALREKLQRSTLKESGALRAETIAATKAQAFEARRIAQAKDEEALILLLLSL